jgi:YidC/Oxa1 family membrane protein insertase
MDIFNTLITTPFSWVLLTLYNFCRSYGLALVLFSLIIKLILLPFSMKSKKNMVKMGRLNPKLKALEKQYKNDREKYAEETQKLYKQYGINPMSGCLWSLLPLPIMLGLYGVVRQPLTNLMKLTADQISTVVATLTSLGVTVGNANSAYGEIALAQQISGHLPEVQAVVPKVFAINYNFLGIDLSAQPSFDFFTTGTWTWAAIGLFLLPLISGLAAFFSMRVATKTNASPSQDGEQTVADKTSQKMSWFMPLISVYIGFIMPAGLCVYWIMNSVFGIVQELVLSKIIGKKLDKEEDARKEQEAILLAEEKKKRAEAATRKYSNKGQKQKPKKEATHEKGQIKDRPYARGRSYHAERFGGDEPSAPLPEQQAASDEGQPPENE